MPWPLPTLESDLLALAKGYPFESPGRSYLFGADAVVPLEPGAAPEVFAERVPVIAHGSNRSPQQLRRKYGNGAEIPVSRAWLAEYDVVYSAHVTQYGAIAANLQHVPGARVEVYVTWLDTAQLERMHETELGGENYHYGEMTEIELSLDVGPQATLSRAYVYLSTRGCLTDQPVSPVGLAAVAAERRDHGALVQEAAIALVRDRHRPGTELDRHILTTIRDGAARRDLIAEMAEHALPAAAPHFRILEG
jgi:hypothetical protein